jgi:hypothetical protein
MVEVTDLMYSVHLQLKENRRNILVQENQVKETNRNLDQNQLKSNKWRISNLYIITSRTLSLILLQTTYKKLFLTLIIYYNSLPMGTL